jgi:hypothetical protein
VFFYLFLVEIFKFCLSCHYVLINKAMFVVYAPKAFLGFLAFCKRSGTFGWELNINVFCLVNEYYLSHFLCSTSYSTNYNITYVKLYLIYLHFKSLLFCKFS